MARYQVNRCRPKGCSVCKKQFGKARALGDGTLASEPFAGLVVAACARAVRQSGEAGGWHASKCYVASLEVAADARSSKAKHVSSGMAR